MSSQRKWLVLLCQRLDHLARLQRLVTNQDRAQVLACVRPLDARHALRRALGDDPATGFAAFRPQIDQPVGALDHIQVVLDHHDRVALIDKSLQHCQQLEHVVEVQTGGWLVQNIEGLAGGAAAQLLAELDALRLAAREGGGRLTELDVAQADFLQGGELGANAGDVLEELQPLVHRHLQHVGDALSLVFDLQRLSVIAMAVTHLARHVHVGQELHLDADNAVALARLAAAALDVEAETPCFVAAHLGLGQRGEKIADVGEQVGVGRRIRAWGAADGRLVDVDHLVEVLDSFDAAVLARPVLRPIHALVQRLVEHLVDQARLAAAADAGNADQLAEREAHVYMFQVVLGRVAHEQIVAVAGAAFGGDVDLLLAAQILRGQAVGAVHEVVGRRGADHVAAEFAGARPHVDDPIGRAHRLLVVLDDEDRVAQVAQIEQGADQPAVVALMQADARLIQDVEHAHELRADLRRQPDALRLAAGEGRRHPVEGQVVQPDIHEEAHARVELLQDLPGDGRSRAG